MPGPLKPRAFRLLDSCTKTCTLSSYQLGPKVAELVHSWYEAGLNNPTIVQRAKQIDVKISEGAAGRHRANHLEPLDEFEDPTEGEPPKVDDIVLIDQVIARGAESLRFKTSRVTTEQLLKAMELKYKLTQGSVWEATMQALAKAMDPAAEGEAGTPTAVPNDAPEDTPALAGADELAQALSE